MQSKTTRIFAFIMVFVLLTLAACSNNTTPSSSEATPSLSSENIREANKPSELLGTPDHIYIVQGENERTIESGTDEYDEVLELLRSRFPEKLKEAARAITWADEAGFNRDMMRQVFDFIELVYDATQIVNLNCMDSDYPLEEITFEMMIFPLTDNTGTVSIDTHKTDNLVGRSYGPLDSSAEIIAELSGYSVVRENGPSESKTESESDEPQSQNKEAAESLQDTDFVSADNAPSGLVFLQDEPELKELKDAIHLMLRPDVKIFAHVSSSWDSSDNDNCETGEVNYTIPKVKFTTSMDLIDAMRQIGMERAFEVTGAFPAMLAMSAINQDTRFEMDENGAKATAVTKIEMESSAAPPPEEEPLVLDLVLDRPFLFAITSNEGYIVFAGIVNNPVTEN